MADVSQMIASFRAQNPVATLGKDDKQVADLMLAQKGVGALTYAEAEQLMKAFSGEPDKIGDNPTFLADKEPQLPQENEAGWKKPALIAGGALAAVAAGVGAVVAGVSAGPLVLGGVAVACLFGLSSCQKTDVLEQNYEFEVDTSGIENAINKLCEKIDKLIEENQALRSDLKSLMVDLKGSIEDMSSQMQTLLNTVITMLGEIKEGDNAKQDLLKEILTQIKAGNETNSDILNKILKAISGMSESSSEFNKQAIELLNQILTTNVEGNAQNKEFFDQVINFIADFKNTAPEIADKFTGILQQIAQSIKDGTEVDKAGFEAVVAALKDIKNADAESAEGLAQILQNMWGDIVNGQAETIDVLKQLTANHLTGNKELQALITTLYGDSQVNATQRHEEIVKAINNVAANVKSLEGTVKATGDAVCEEIRNLGAQIAELFADYKAGNIDAKAILDKLDGIIGGVVDNNVLSKESNELLTKLLDKAGSLGNNGNVNDYSEVLQQILEAINKVVAGIEDIKIGLGESNGNIVAALQEIIENQDEQTTTLKDVQDDIKNISNDLKAFAKESTANQQKLIAQGDEILAAIKGLNIDMNQGVGDIIAQLKGDHADLAAQLAAMADAMGVKMDENGQAIVDAVEGLKGKLDGIEDLIENLINIAGSGSVDLTTTNNLIQTVINLLNRPTTGGGEVNVDLGEVTQLLAKNNELMEALLTKDGPDMNAFMEALDGIREAVENIEITNGNGQATDLTTTNNLIQTCIQQLQLLVQAESNNADIMSSVTNLGTQLTEVIANLQSGNVTTDEINAKLDKIMEAIKSIAPQG